MVLSRVLWVGLFALAMSAVTNGAKAQSQVWYYCESSKTYFPYVQRCQTPWRLVQATTQPHSGLASRIPGLAPPLNDCDKYVGAYLAGCHPPSNDPCDPSYAGYHVNQTTAMLAQQQCAAQHRQQQQQAQIQEQQQQAAPQQMQAQALPETRVPDQSKPCAGTSGDTQEQCVLGLVANKNYAAARKVYGDMASSGEYLAAYSIGETYEKGEGALVDYVLAYKWYDIAVALGARAIQQLPPLPDPNGPVTDESVKQTLHNKLVTAFQKHDISSRDKTAAHLNAAQLAEAQNLSRQWQAVYLTSPPKPQQTSAPYASITQDEATAMMWRKVHAYCATATPTYCAVFSGDLVKQLTQCIYAKSNAIGIYEDIKLPDFPPELVLRNFPADADIVQLATETKAQSSDEFSEDIFWRCLKTAKIED